MENNFILYGIVGLGLFIIVFLFLREILLWYWKVNAIIDNQNKTNQLLEKQNELLEENTATLQQFVDDFMNK
jgi:Tfp pilus assembly protein PilN